MIWIRRMKALPTAYNFSWYLWKNIFVILLKKLAKRHLYSSRLQQFELSVYVFPVWRYWTTPKNKKTHYVIKNAFRNNWLLLGIFYVNFCSTISQKVDEIFQFWTVIWTRLMKALPTAYNFSWYLWKILLGFYWKNEQKDTLFK